LGEVAESTRDSKVDDFWATPRHVAALDIVDALKLR
jgi:hypothetical protein